MYEDEFVVLYWDVGDVFEGVGGVGVGVFGNFFWVDVVDDLCGWFVFGEEGGFGCGDCFGGDCDFFGDGGLSFVVWVVVGGVEYDVYVGDVVCWNDDVDDFLWFVVVGGDEDCLGVFVECGLKDVVEIICDCDVGIFEDESGVLDGLFCLGVEYEVGDVVILCKCGSGE